MRTLCLLRHAEAGPAPRDIDRALTPGGALDAEAVGRRLAAAGMQFDHVAASPARRVRETLAAVATGMAAVGGALPAPAWDDALYLPTPERLLAAVRALPTGARAVLIAGHQPGLGRLARLLAPEAVPFAHRDFPTAGLAELCVPHGWADVAPGTARLGRALSPHDLEVPVAPEALAPLTDWR